MLDRATVFPAPPLSLIIMTNRLLLVLARRSLRGFRAAPPASTLLRRVPGRAAELP
jgi:hypothetical protein